MNDFGDRRSGTLGAGVFSRQPRRVVTALAVASMIVPVVAGCAATGSGEGGATTLTVQLDAGNLPFFEAVAEEFEAAHEGVEVKLSTITAQQKITTNTQVLSSANPPDIGLAPVNAPSYAQLVDANAVVSLEDVWADADLEKRYGPTLAGPLMTGDDVYAVLFKQSQYGMIYYNKDLFAELGIQIPDDHQLRSEDELYDIVGALTDSGRAPIGLGGNGGYQLGWLLDSQLEARASAAELENFNTSWQEGVEQTVPYTSAPFVDSLEQIQVWYDDGVFQPGMLSQSPDQSLAGFVAGTTGALIGGTWTVAALEEENVPFDVGWFLLPSEDGDGTLATAYAGDTMVIPTGSKNQDLAKEFLTLMMSDSVQAKLPALGQIPSVTLPEGDDSMSDLPALVQDIVAFGNESGTGIGWTAVVPGALGQAFIDPEIQKQLSGSQTAEDTARAQQAQYDSFITDN